MSATFPAASTVLIVFASWSDSQSVPSRHRGHSGKTRSFAMTVEVKVLKPDDAPYRCRRTPSPPDLMAQDSVDHTCSPDSPRWAAAVVACMAIPEDCHIQPGPVQLPA